MTIITCTYKWIKLDSVVSTITTTYCNVMQHNALSKAIGKSKLLLYPDNNNKTDNINEKLDCVMTTHG